MALAAARQKSAAQDAVARESRLGEIWWPSVEQSADDSYAALISAGAAPRESATAVVLQMVSKRVLNTAEPFIEEWLADTGDAAHGAYLRGLWRHAAGDRDAAKDALAETLKVQPDHEPARAALAQMLEEEYDFDASLAHYAVLLNGAPSRRTLRVDASRVLRAFGRVDDARIVLQPVVGGDLSLREVLELADIEYESGDYRAASRWFQTADEDEAHRAETLRTAASALAFQGDSARAEALFGRVAGAQRRARQLSEWRRRIELDPGDTPAANELQGLTSPVVADASDANAEHVSPRYLEHCAACHGPIGAGDGRAARHLYPRPSNFREGRRRLVSTLNGVSTLDDLQRVIRMGIPGTSMPAFEDLTDEVRTELAKQIQQFHRSGTQDRLRRALQQEGDVPDDDEIAALAKQLTTPGEVLPVPNIDVANPASIETGRALYVRFGCDKCHGATGTGANDVLLRDEAGRPILPRDLVHDPMKGGSDPESLYRRIRLGMPGTPHPASPTLTPAEIVDLVQFCRSLAQDPARSSTNHERSERAFAVSFAP